MDNPVMTTIGDALRAFISEQDKQVALAQRWLELWRERHSKKNAWQSSTVESQLSRLMKSDAQGVRFFFDDPARADILFEVLGVPEEERVHIRALAEQVRQPSPRLVVDISTWPGRGEPLEALFDELENKVLRDCPLQPIALVLTEQQWAKSPRTWDARINQRTLVLHKIADPAEGPPLVGELAGDAALVLAPWQFDPVDRWLAAEFNKNTLSFEPDDGLASFAEQGTLPPVPDVAHPLEQICEPAAVTFKVDRFTPLGRRWWIYALADETRTTEALKHNDGIREPAQRLAFARQLGAAATSTARERLEHEFEQLSVQLCEALKLPVEVLDAAAHANRLERAELRPMPAAAWRCGDTIHLLHVDAPIEHPRIEVHRPVPAVPALTRLLQEMSDWSAHDHEADPSLARAVETLDPEARERPAFLHARAAVLWNNLRPKPQSEPPCERWAEELRAILAHDPPPASLRLRLPEPRDDRKAPYLAFEDDDRLCAPLTAPSSMLARPPGRRTIIADRERKVLKIETVRQNVEALRIDTSSGGSVAVSHDGSSTKIFTNPPDYDYYNRHDPQEIPQLWLPVLAATTPDSDLWLDCLERSSALANWEWEHSARCEQLLRTTGHSQINLFEVGEIEAYELSIAPATWLETDLLLAQCWLAFRAALEHPLSVQIGAGVVCSLGAGVCAHLAVHTRRRSSPLGVVAAFDATVEHGQVTLDFRPVWTHAAQVDGYTAEFGVRVPSHLVLQTPTLSANITFLASPLLQASTPATIGSIATMVAAQIAAKEEQELYDDD